MTYVISDIHGNYGKLKEMLEKIRFSDDDLLYVLGDMVDVGDEPIEVLLDFSMRSNVYPIIGECDLRAAKLLSAFDKMSRGGEPDEECIAEMSVWVNEGGKPTLEGFRILDDDMKEGIIDYLTDCTLYEELTVNGKDYLLVHAGIADFSPDTDMDDYQPEDFVSEPLDSERRYFEDKIIIVGHTPTESRKIEYGNGSIMIDCGASYGGKLACLRLEDGKEFYV